MLFIMAKAERWDSQKCEFVSTGHNDSSRKTPIDLGYIRTGLAEALVAVAGRHGKDLRINTDDKGSGDTVRVTGPKESNLTREWAVAYRLASFRKRRAQG